MRKALRVSHSDFGQRRNHIKREAPAEGDDSMGSTDRVIGRLQTRLGGYANFSIQPNPKRIKTAKIDNKPMGGSKRAGVKVDVLQNRLWRRCRFRVAGLVIVRTFAKEGVGRIPGQGVRQNCGGANRYHHYPGGVGGLLKYCTSGHGTLSWPIKPDGPSVFRARCSVRRWLCAGRTGVMGPPNVPNNVGRVPAGNSDQSVAEERPCQVYDYPTVLVARNDEGMGGPLVNCLQRNGFHVLEANNWEQVFDLVRVHSRPIHLLLADVSIDAIVPILKKHRSELLVLFVEKPVDLDEVLVKVRRLLGSPPSPSSIR